MNENEPEFEIAHCDLIHLWSNLVSFAFFCVVEDEFGVISVTLIESVTLADCGVF